MDDEEIIALVRQVLRDDDGDIPADLQPSAEFWQRIDQEPEPQAHRPGVPVAAATRTHQLAPAAPTSRRWPLYVAAAACLTLIAGGVVLARTTHSTTPPSVHASTPVPTLSIPSPTMTVGQATYALYRSPDYTPNDRCIPGPTVTPTRTPPPGAASLTDSLDLSTLPGGDDRIVDPRRPFDTDSFDAITDVGGCVQAWLEPRGSAIPDDTESFTVDGHDFAQRANAAGLTEVYLQSGQVIYVAASGNVARQDLATALLAALTMP